MRLLSLVLFGIVLSPDFVRAQTTWDIPAGAVERGFLKKVFDFSPTLQDIAPANSSRGFKLYDGVYFQNAAADKKKYFMRDGVLAVPNGSSLATQKRSGEAGSLPYLKGSKGFYVEADISLNSNDPQLFSAFWLLPKEHDNRLGDNYPGDPPGYSRWMELDIDEGRFSVGTTSSVIDWEGVWDKNEGKYFRDPPHNTIPGPRITNFRSSTPLDRTQRHVFGASYEPSGAGTVRWYLDGKLIATAGDGAAPQIAKKQNFYIIVGNQYHGVDRKYELYIHRLSAWSGD